jgi:hypothetical protein
MTEGTRGRSFDALAKGLASGDVSRGKALKLMGAALLGGLLASIPTVAGAKPKANKCIKDKQCPAGTTCVSGVCVNAPNVLYCSCQDGTQLDTCTSLDCGSDFVPGSGSDQVCASLCGARHGGGSANFCIANNYPQCGAVPPPPPGPGPNNVDCHCQDGTVISTCRDLDCGSGVEQDNVCRPLCESYGGISATGCLPDSPTCVGQA